MITFKSGIFPTLEILSHKDNEILTLLLLLLISVGYKSSNKQSSSHNRGYNKPNYSWIHCRHLDGLSVKKAAKNWVLKQSPSQSSSFHYLGLSQFKSQLCLRGGAFEICPPPRRDKPKSPAAILVMVDPA